MTIEFIRQRKWIILFGSSTYTLKFKSIEIEPEKPSYVN